MGAAVAVVAVTSGVPVAVIGAGSGVTAAPGAALAGATFAVRAGASIGSAVAVEVGGETAGTDPALGGVDFTAVGEDPAATAGAVLAVDSDRADSTEPATNGAAVGFTADGEPVLGRVPDPRQGAGDVTGLCPVEPGRERGGDGAELADDGAERCSSVITHGVAPSGVEVIASAAATASTAPGVRDAANSAVG